MSEVSLVGRLSVHEKAALVACLSSAIAAACSEQSPVDCRGSLLKADDKRPQHSLRSLPRLGMRLTAQNRGHSTVPANRSSISYMVLLSSILALWEFTKTRSPNIDPKRRARIVRTPRKKTPAIHGNSYLTLVKIILTCLTSYPRTLFKEPHNSRFKEPPQFMTARQYYWLAKKTWIIYIYI